MLKKQHLTKISELIKVPLADLEKAITEKEEVDVTIPEDLNVFTKTELETRDNNQKTEGIKVGKDLGIKEVKKAAGLADDAGKDPTTVASLIIDKAVKDAKINPNDKVVELTEQVKGLQRTIGEKDIEIANEKKISQSVSTDRQILANMPKNRADVFEDDEYLDILRNKHVKEVDGKLVPVGKDGQPLRDKMQNILALNEGLKQIFSERKGWLAEAAAGGPPGGRGGKDDNKNTGFAKRSEVIKHYEDQGISPNGEKGQEIVAKLQELAKADPSFDMNN